MAEVDFTSDLWLFASPWCEDKLDDDRYADDLSHAWVALWNYTMDRTSSTASQIHRLCNDLFEKPSDELVEILTKRRAVFFPDDSRLIEHYRVVSSGEEFTIHVEFAEPNHVQR
jgi:hypothetical protein